MNANPTGNNTLDWALHYAAHGYRVIPIKPNEKRPPMGAWQDVATTQTGTIRAWWQGNYSGHGIGIVTGALENGTRFFALDLDEHGETTSGSATLKQHEQNNSELPPTISARTGSGGRHMLYKLADHHPELGNGAGRLLGVGVDVRAINAQIVAAPTIHPNGKTYEWENGHGIGEIAMATAPDWLVDLLIPKQYTANDLNIRQTASEPHIKDMNSSINDERAGTKFNRTAKWDNLLSADGWTPHHQEQDTYYWTRPNKQKTEGISASVNYKGNDALTVFTTSIVNLPAGTYDKFGYWTQTRHNGDFKDAARTLNQTDDHQIAEWIETIQQDSTPKLATTTDLDPLSSWYVDWQQFWSTDNQQREWLVEPFLARGRAHALYASAKSGKSLMLLEIAAALATGKAVLNQPQREPMPVLYIDYEMTASDIKDRLEAFGYSENDNMQHLHYVLLPSIAGLDTPEGAKTVIQAIQAKNIQLVVIDTTARAVEGEENDADTLRAFYRWSGVNMKSLGVTWIRADHAGKDSSKGQRGSSAKNDDVDVVWRFTKRAETSILLEATHRRMQWIPDKIEIELREVDNILVHRIVNNETTEAVTKLAETLTKINMPPDTSVRAARIILKQHNIRASSDILRNALRLRRQQTDTNSVTEWLDTVEAVGTGRGTYSQTDTAQSDSTIGGTARHSATPDSGTLSAHSGTPLSGVVPSVPRSKERHNNDTPDLDLFDELF